MESPQDLNCSTKRNPMKGQQPWYLLTILSRDIFGLDMYREYEFQVLAFNSVRDGPNSPVKLEKTMEDGETF